MKRFLKAVGITLGIVAVIAIAAIIVLVTFVNPNRFKPLITEQVKKYTGRELIIDGNLSWTLFPYLGVSVGHLELSNPPEFKQKPFFAEIQGATIGVKFLPLLKSKIQSSGMTLKGLKLNLIKNANGKTNWQDLSAATTASSTSSAPVETSSAQKATLGLAISGIDISNAEISWTNDQAKQTMAVQQFELHAKDISVTKPFPLETSFHFVGQNPARTGDVNLKGNIALNMEKQIFSFDNITVTAKIQEGAKKYDINFTGDAVADLIKQRLQLDNLSAHVANLAMTGKVNVTNLLAKPKTTGHLHVDPFDVKKWLAATGQDAAALQTMSNLTGDFDFTALDSLKSVDLQGNVKIDEIKASNVRLTNVNVKTVMQAGVLNLAPLTANFYQGTLDGQTKVNLNAAVPLIAVQAKLVNVQAEPLMEDLAANQKIKIAGVGNIGLQASTSGASGDDIVKNLSGTAQLSFANGVIKGIDIGYMIDSAASLTGAPATTSTDTKQTPFGTLTANAVIAKGVITNNDLLISATRFETKGNGTINLVEKSINYHLLTAIKQQDATNTKNNAANLYGLQIPIAIAGNLTDPSIKLESSTLMKSVAQQQVEKVKTSAKEKIQEQLKGKLPGKAGDLLNSLLGQ